MQYLKSAQCVADRCCICDFVDGSGQKREMPLLVYRANLLSRSQLLLWFCSSIIQRSGTTSSDENDKGLDKNNNTGNHNLIKTMTTQTRMPPTRITTTTTRNNHHTVVLLPVLWAPSHGSRHKPNPLTTHPSCHGRSSTKKNRTEEKKRKTPGSKTRMGNLREKLTRLGKPGEQTWRTA